MSFVAQDPERPWHGFGCAVEQVFPITEKREIVVVEPAQEIRDLGTFRGRHRGCGRAR